MCVCVSKVQVISCGSGSGEHDAWTYSMGQKKEGTVPYMYMYRHSTVNPLIVRCPHKNRTCTVCVYVHVAPLRFRTVPFLVTHAKIKVKERMRSWSEYGV